jgi:hypothetical protein
MPGVSKGEVSKTLHAAKTRGTPLAEFPGPRPLGVSPVAGPNGPLASRTVSLPELKTVQRDVFIQQIHAAVGSEARRPSSRKKALRAKRTASVMAAFVILPPPHRRT